MLRPTDVDFNRQIYILASVHHIKDHAAHPSPKCNDVEQKHLTLLNYIALLLVTKPRGDVAAITMEISTSAIDFYYAKNRPCDRSTQIYVDRVLTILRKDKLDDIPKSLMMVVMVECVDKVRNRIWKCQKGLEDCEELGTSSLDLLSGNILANTLHTWAGLNDSEILQSFFKELRSFVTSILSMRSQPRSSILMSQKACVIGTITLHLLTSITAFLIQS